MSLTGGGSLQDYVVSGSQPHLRAYRTPDGSYAQFVSTPIGSLHTLTARLDSHVEIAGLEFGITPTKRTCFDIRIVYRRSEGYSTTYLQVEGSMDIAMVKKMYMSSREGGPSVDSQIFFFAGRELEDCKLL